MNADSSKKAVENKKEAVKAEKEEGGKKAVNRWSIEFDETTKCFYYYDNNTHVTTWEKPDDFEESQGGGE